MNAKQVVIAVKGELPLAIQASVKWGYDSYMLLGADGGPIGYLPKEIKEIRQGVIYENESLKITA